MALYLQSPLPEEAAAALTAFREAIRDLGYIEGQTIVLDFRLSKGIMDALPALAAELVRIHHFRQAAGYVDRIIRGTKPGDLPINALSKFDFVINLRTARALGLTPPPDFTSAANEVIE